jgi:hypothetical protein
MLLVTAISQLLNERTDRIDGRQPGTVRRRMLATIRVALTFYRLLKPWL